MQHSAVAVGVDDFFFDHHEAPEGENVPPKKDKVWPAAVLKVRKCSVDVRSSSLILSAFFSCWTFCPSGISIRLKLEPSANMTGFPLDRKEDQRVRNLYKIKSMGIMWRRI